jgi:hypothetical protein
MRYMGLDWEIGDLIGDIPLEHFIGLPREKIQTLYDEELDMPLHALAWDRHMGSQGITVLEIPQN